MSMLKPQLLPSSYSMKSINNFPHRHCSQASNDSKLFKFKFKFKSDPDLVTLPSYKNPFIFQ